MTAARTLTDADVEAIAEAVARRVAPVAPEPSPWLTSEAVAAVWLVIEREPWEADRVVAICASKAGAWRAAYRRRYEHAVEEREDQLRGYDPWTRPAVVIERRDLLP